MLLVAALRPQWGCVIVVVTLRQAHDQRAEQSVGCIEKAERGQEVVEEV